VTGVARLHYTVTTGDICSKGAAARYARATFPPRWHRIADEALRIRQADRAASGVLRPVVAGWADYLPVGPAGAPRPLFPTPLARRRDLLAFGDMAIRDAHRRFDERSAAGG